MKCGNAVARLNMNGDRKHLVHHKADLGATPTAGRGRAQAPAGRPCEGAAIGEGPWIGTFDLILDTPKGTCQDISSPSRSAVLDSFQPSLLHIGFANSTIFPVVHCNSQTLSCSHACKQDLP